jgi:SRSO17 transposase
MSGEFDTSVSANHHFRSWRDKSPVAGAAAQIAQGLASSAWRRLSAGEGTKGARLDDWAYCESGAHDRAEAACQRAQTSDGELADLAGRAWGSS